MCAAHLKSIAKICRQANKKIAFTGHVERGESLVYNLYSLTQKQIDEHPTRIHNLITYTAL
jgi:hypothetical protein